MNSLDRYNIPVGQTFELKREGDIPHTDICEVPDDQSLEHVFPNNQGQVSNNPQVGKAFGFQHGSKIGHTGTIETIEEGQDGVVVITTRSSIYRLTTL
jgi:hypothetical protein